MLNRQLPNAVLIYKISASAIKLQPIVPSNYLTINKSHEFAGKHTFEASKNLKKIALKPSQSAANPYLCTPNFGNVCLQSLK
jgi:hypothetical protein